MQMNKSLIIKGLALAAVIFFFLPFFTVSCNSAILQKDIVTLNGLNMMMGVQSSDLKDFQSKIPGDYGYPEKAQGNILAGILLLLPVGMLLILFTKRKNKDLLVLIGAIICIFICLYLRMEVANQAGAFNEIRNRMGFYLTILAHIGIIGYIVYEALFARSAVQTEVLPSAGIDMTILPNPVEEKSKETTV